MQRVAGETAQNQGQAAVAARMAATGAGEEAKLVLEFEPVSPAVNCSSYIVAMSKYPGCCHHRRCNAAVRSCLGRLEIPTSWPVEVIT